MKSPLFFLVLIIIIYSLIFSFLSIGRHRSLHSTYLDLGLESQTIWNTSQGRLFENSFGSGGEIISSLSYHMTPIIIFLAPIYKLFPSPETLLVAQSLILSFGALAVYLISSRILKNENLSPVFSLVYLLYPAMEYSNLSDFHYVTMGTTFLLFCFYFIISRQWNWFYLFLILTVSTKENLAIISALFGLYLFFVLKEKRRGISVFLFSLGYFLFSIFYLMPKLGGSFTGIGRYSTLMENPLLSLLSLFNPDKIKYLFHLLISVGFLPVLAPAALIFTGSEIFLNLLSDYNPQWQVKFHYTAAITPFVFIAAVYGAKRLKGFIDSKLPNFRYPNFLIVLYLLSPAILWNIVHSPSPLYYKFDWSKYRESGATREARSILSQIPAEASVSVMNNLGPQITNRRFLYRFPIKYLEADYVALDPRAVDEDYDLSQVSPSSYQDLLAILRKSQGYEIIADQSQLLLYRKKL